MKIKIGIDPDVDKSGFAVFDAKKRKLISLEAFNFFALVNELEQIRNDLNTEKITVYVEAGWLNKSNWHLTRNDSKASAAAKGVSVGRNQQVGMLIVEACEHLDIEVHEQRPLKKTWKGRNGKITHSELARIVPGMPKASNQEKRDAALIGWVNL